ncbi:hypothetical protein VTN77DRAFT_6148 [Rasamsonia byssochlamydoides]|uniref:uncharacterized protein n=1 Tax=Rasamsonia byssochlamydoides TaxID=89139 RepID=UPI0037440FD4
MAYRAIAQTDHDVLSNASGSDTDEHHTSPLHPTSLESPIEPAKTVEESTAAGRLGSFIQSMRANSYEMVEDDDYEVADHGHASPTNARQTERSCPGAQHDPGPHARHSNTPLPHSSSPEPLVRTSSGSAVLRHPTPDLQSLQGAYVGNIERLEKSAERLSMTSSDLGAELRKLDQEQKRRSSVSSILHAPDSPARQFSAGSMSNSIIGVNSAARTGGYSPGGFVSSPKGSILSGSGSYGGSRFRSTSVNSRLADVLEPQHEEDQENAAPVDRDVPLLANPPPPPPQYQGQDQNQNEVPGIPYDENVPAETPLQDLPDRPETALSTDTYQQATNLFLDFDGVHFVPHRQRESSLSRQVSLNKPPLASNAQHYEEPQAGQNLVYYPAPIPKVLNLPQRLSKRPPVSELEKRRTQLLNTMSVEDKKVAEGNENGNSKRASNIPPQLRASVFFDQPSSSLNIQMKDQSAVITLDSILDASAHAPVTAFTDHPIVGHVGSEVYGKAAKKPSSRDLAEKRKKHSSAAPRVPSDQTHGDSDRDAAEAIPLRASTHSGDLEGAAHSALDRDEHEGLHNGDEDDHDNQGGGDGEAQEGGPILFGRPTTLLAELEMRKQEQKQRNRTAATAFPNGMHSTLLELDAVAQAQSNARRHKPVTLAWEAPPTDDPDGADDEDVPLGVLFAGKNPAVGEARPLGLLERRELEDNEPLSRRRARLRGEAPPDPVPTKRASTMLHPPAPGPADSDSGDENETLAQRLRRLKAQNQSKTVVSADFASEIMAELNKLGDPPPAEEQKNTQPEAVVDEEEETLGQRKKRLQAEAKAQKAERGPDLKDRRSMASILQAYPASNARQASVDNRRASHAPTHYPNRMSAMYNRPPSMAYSAAGFPQYPPAHGVMPGYGMPPAYGNGFYNNSFMHNPNQMGMNGFGYGMPSAPGHPMPQPTIDPKQREMIDRWRQSIMM